MKRICVFSLSLIILGGCINEDVTQTGTGYHPTGIIQIQPKASATRGTPIYNEWLMTDMGVFCSHTGTNDWTSADVPDKMFNRKLIYNDGNWDYDGSPEKWHAETMNDRFTFFAYAPFASSGNGMVVNGTSSTVGIPSLNYTVPEDVTLQPDLMVSVPRKDLLPMNTPVDLEMKHALTCVGFQVAGYGNKIQGIAIKGVSMSGTLTMDGENILWTNTGPVDVTTDFTASLNTDEGETYYTAKPELSTDLMKDDGYLMMIPQELRSDARIIITETDGKTFEIGLNGYTWEPGIRVNYSITIVPGGTITVFPSQLLLPWFGVNQHTDNISVLCNDKDGNPTDLPWKLTTDADWFTMTLDDKGQSATNTVSGKGSQTVYTLATENPSTTEERNTEVYLDDDPDDVRVKVTQVKKPDAGIIPGGGTPIVEKTYVGAFWRAAQTGERIIKIDVGTSGANIGKWSASVIWMDKNWEKDDIVLSSAETEDKAIYTEQPGNAESYEVVAPPGAVNPSSTSGTVHADGFIMFRIGLKTQWNLQSGYDRLITPARYAVVVVSYNDYSRHQKIFLRQGHEDDYLIHPDENGGSPYIKRFSPYNLIGRDMTDTADFIQIFIRGTQSGGRTPSAFTNFPTMAGCMFQWAGGPNADGRVYARRAYHPVRTYSASNWKHNHRDASNYWTPIAATHETCPPGYRRPNLYTGEPIISEINESLLSDRTNPLKNSVYGYYADGHFDRLQIVKSRNDFEKTTVLPIHLNVAYIGRLFFNDIAGSKRENASLFFSMPGFRYYTTSELQASGRNGHYWLSTAYRAVGEDDKNFFGCDAVVSINNFEPYTKSYRAHAMPIRCVVE